MAEVAFMVALALWDMYAKFCVSLQGICVLSVYAGDAMPLLLFCVTESSSSPFFRRKPVTLCCVAAKEAGACCGKIK